VGSRSLMRAARVDALESWRESVQLHSSNKTTNVLYRVVTLRGREYVPVRFVTPTSWTVGLRAVACCHRGLRHRPDQSEHVDHFRRVGVRTSGICLGSIRLSK